jgi:hypothetical protein
MRYFVALVCALSLCSFVKAADAAAEPGLKAEYFDMENAIEDYPTLPADKKPTVSRIDKQVNYESVDEKFAGTDLNVHFYVRWTGILRIPKDGKYTLYTVSDDGSRVFIDGKQVVDNGGLHAMEEKSAEVDLKAGDHDLKLELFENDGEVGCKLSWESANLTKEILTDAVLTHKKDKDLDK